MSIAAENLPLPHHDVRKKATASRGLIKKSCRDAMAYKLAAVAMVFKKMFQVSLPRLFWTRNIGIRPSDSFSLRVFHL
jgi:hypothetical protein